MRVERGEVTARARNDPSTERRVLEALRVMPQREAVRRELLLEPRTGRPRLDARGARHRVDLEHAVHRSQIDGDRAVPRAPAGPLDAADDARPAAEGDHRESIALAPREHARHVLFVTRERDRVGRPGEVPREGACDVAVPLAVRVQRALAPVDRDDRRELRGHDRARFGHADRREGRRDAQRGLGDAQRAGHLLREGAARVVPREAIGPSPRPQRAFAAHPDFVPPFDTQGSGVVASIP